MRSILIRGGILFAAFFIFSSRAHGQGVELPCPAGTQAVQSHNTANNTTGKLRQNLCVDNAGNLSMVISGPFFPGIIDDTLATMKSFLDPNNGVNGQAGYIFRSTPLVSNDATSVQNFAMYIGGELDCHPTVTEECHYMIVFPVIRRNSGPGIADKITGVSFAAPIAPPGDTSTATSHITATISIESNPPTSWCDSGGTDATALANLGICTFSLNLSAGPLSTRNTVMFYGPAGGLRNGLGDLGFDNRDTTGTGTTTFYSGGGLRSQMLPNGTWTHKNTTIWNYASPQIQWQGTEGSARNYSIQESAGSLTFLDNTSVAQRMEINAPGIGAGTGTVNFDVGTSLTERAATSGAAGLDSCYGDSTAHTIKCNYNNATNFHALRVTEVGTCTMAAGTCTVTWSAAFNATPIVAATWNGTGTFTTGASLKCTATTTNSVCTSSTGTDTAVIMVTATGNPN